MYEIYQNNTRSEAFTKKKKHYLNGTTTIVETSLLPAAR